MLKFLKDLLIKTPGKSEALRPALWLFSVILLANFIVAGGIIYLDDPPVALSYLQGSLLGILPFVIGHIVGTHNFLIRNNIEALKKKKDKSS